MSILSQKIITSRLTNAIFLWRRDRDSNPRGCYTYTRSRRAPSTTRPSLHDLVTMSLCYYTIVNYVNKARILGIALLIFIKLHPFMPMKFKSRETELNSVCKNSLQSLSFGFYPDFRLLSPVFHFLIFLMAERARFELARDVNLYPLSRRALSTAQPSLRVVF
jgi:hypothetical protein